MFLRDRDLHRECENIFGNLFDFLFIFFLMNLILQDYFNYFDQSGKLL